MHAVNLKKRHLFTDLKNQAQVSLLLDTSQIVCHYRRLLNPLL